MKYIKIFVVGCFLFLFLSLECNASTRVFTRSNQNLLVPEDVVVDQSNLNNILSTPAVSSAEKVYDYAELFTDEEGKKIVKKINEYINNAMIDVAIVTTKDLKGKSIADYAYNFYDYNDFMNDGVIFVIYMNKDNPEIYMGNSGNKDGKVFNIYTDTRINQTLEYVYKDIKAGNYYKAVDNYVKILSGFYNIERNGDFRVNGEGEVVQHIPWIEIVILALALTFIVIVILFCLLNRKRESIDLFQKVNTDTLMVRTDGDNLVGTMITNDK